MRSKERFGETDAAGVGVEEVEIWFEEFFRVGGENIFHAGPREMFDRAEMRSNGRGKFRPYRGGGGIA